MHTPETSRLFTRWRNPSNGVASLVLTERVAPVQQSFYCTNPSFSADGRYICYTTTVHDRVDVALVPVAALIARTA